jgi:hypothetical protein
LAQSDIFLLGDAKRMLCRCSFYNADEAFLAIPRIARGIENYILIGLFQEWMRLALKLKESTFRGLNN